MNNLTKTLIESSYTKKQALSRLELIRQNIQSKLFTKETQGSKPSDDQVWVDSLNPEVLAELTKENSSQIFDSSKQEIETLKLLIVYLSFDPEKESIDKIGKWVKENISKDMLMEIKISPKLIAGCALSYNGFIKDFSIKSRIEQNRAEVLANLQRFNKAGS